MQAVDIVRMIRAHDAYRATPLAQHLYGYAYREFSLFGIGVHFRLNYVNGYVVKSLTLRTNEWVIRIVKNYGCKWSFDGVEPDAEILATLVLLLGMPNEG